MPIIIVLVTEYHQTGWQQSAGQLLKQRKRHLIFYMEVRTMSDNPNKCQIIHIINHSDVKIGGAQIIVRDLYCGLRGESKIISFDLITTPENGDKPSTPLKALLTIFAHIIFHKKSVFFIHHRLFLPVFILFRRKAVFVCHNIFPNKNFIYKFIGRIFCVAVSNDVSLYLKRHNKNLAVETIENGVQLDENECRKVTSNIPYKIGFVGRLDKQKGIDLLVSAFLEIRRCYPQLDLELHIVGDGDLRSELLATIEDSAVSHRVFFYGYQEFPFSILTDMNLICVPSRYEGYGMVLYEAIARRHLILASDIDTFQNSAVSDRIVFFKNNDRTSLKATLIEIIQKPNGPILTINDLQLQTTDQMLRHYENVLENYHDHD